MSATDLCLDYLTSAYDQSEWFGGFLLMSLAANLVLGLLVALKSWRQPNVSAPSETSQRLVR